MANYTDTEWCTVTNALRVAADKFAEDARYLHHQALEHPTVYKRLAEQFDKQAAEARGLAAKIEEQEGV